MFSSLPYWSHCLYHPRQQNYFQINSLIQQSYNNNIAFETFIKKFSARFACGNNWRMHSHHGLTNLFNHILHNPHATDIYDVIGQAYKQIE